MKLMSNISNEKWGVLNKQLENLGVNCKKIVEKFILGSGSGGQKINKTSATVQLTYDSFSITYGKSRYRDSNRYFARKELVEQIERDRGIKTKKLAKIEKIIKQKKRRKKKSAEKHAKPDTNFKANKD